MKLLITGGCGFIGTCTSLKAMEQGNEVIVFDSMVRLGVEYNLMELSKHRNFFFIRGDVRNIEDFKRVPEVDAIIHLAANPGIPWSIKWPRYDFEVNAGGTLNVLEFARERGNIPVIYASCYDEKTRALTKDGLKKYTELKKGDIVFSLNSETEEIEEKQISNIIIQDYNGSMVNFHGKREDLLVTPNHRMYIKKKDWKGNFKSTCVERADKVSKKRVSWLPSAINGFRGKQQEFFSFDEKNLPPDANRLNDKIKMEDLFYLIGFFIGDGSLQRQVIKKTRKTNLTHKQWTKAARIDSSVFKKLPRKPTVGYDTTSTIFFHVPGGDRGRIRIEKTLKSIGIDWHVARSKKAGDWGIFFSSISLFELFSQCGTSAYRKKIPKWVLEYDSKYLQYLYEGLMDSDGDKKGRGFTTISPTLTNNFIELAIKLNKKVSFKSYEPKNSYIVDHEANGKYKCYRISIANLDVALYGKKNSTIEKY